jgi:IS30 family transposase
MPKHYHHLTYEKRCQILAWSQTKMSQRRIAEEVKVSQSTVSRELRRNKASDQFYNPDQAHEIAKKKRCQRQGRFFRLTQQIIDYIEDKICNNQWSPEQICGRLQLDENIKISPQTVYNYIVYEKKQGRRLYRHLRRKGKRYRYDREKEQKIIKDRVDISLRDKLVDENKQVGHWEGDSIVGAGHKGGLTTLVERVSGLTKLKQQEKLKAEPKKKGIIDVLKPLKKWVLTIT